MEYIEFLLSRTMVTPCFDKFSFFGIFNDAIVGFRHRKIAVTIGDKDIAVRGNKNVGRTVKVIRPLTGYAGLPSILSTRPSGANCTTICFLPSVTQTIPSSAENRPCGDSNTRSQN
ncbi:hypothetical protein [Bradyrhizobium sp. USDA 4448]